MAGDRGVRIVGNDSCMSKGKREKLKQIPTVCICGNKLTLAQELSVLKWLLTVFEPIKPQRRGRK